MALIDTIGFVAGTLTTISFVPQVLKTWREKSAKDISLSMFLIFSLGIFLWLLYGVGKGELPIVLPNLITLILASTILGFKFKYG
jgi:MtN3 and saliva related transmembrane protein